MKVAKIVQHEEEMLKLAGNIARAMQRGAVFYLHGDLGVGKTTFSRGFLRGLGYEGKVKSPTYNLIESYQIAKKRIFHLDLYRLKNPQECLYLGLEEVFIPDALVLIEWPEKGGEHLPLPDIICTISWLSETSRELIFSVEKVNSEFASLIKLL